VVVSQLPDAIAGRVRAAAAETLQRGGLEGPVDITAMPALDPGVTITLWADDGRCLLGADQLGERGVPSEQVGGRAAEDLVREVQGLGSVDVHGADQLLVYAALAAQRGPCAYAVREASAHLRTNAEVVERFLPVRVRFEGEAPVRVRVEPRA
jgi:RNA 3'-terminal phosphate cyclase